MAYFIGEDCVGCGACAGACPLSCIDFRDNKYVIDKVKCVSCGTCAEICPFNVPKPSSDDK